MACPGSEEAGADGGGQRSAAARNAVRGRSSEKRIEFDCGMIQQVPEGVSLIAEVGSAGCPGDRGDGGGQRSAAAWNPVRGRSLAKRIGFDCGMIQQVPESVSAIAEVKSATASHHRG